MSLESRINRGEEAKQLLDSPLLVAAFSMLEKTYTDDWKTSMCSDIGLREMSYQRLAALGDFRGQLTAFVTDGHIAKSQVKKL